MRLADLEAITRALNKAEVRYLIAGGLAVNTHGYQRLTHDLAVVIQLRAANIRAAFATLDPLGYRPTVPVTGAQFADAAQRQSWIEGKGMEALNLFSDTYPDTPIDLFVTEPFEFDIEYEHALCAEIAANLEVRFVSIPAASPRSRGSISVGLANAAGSLSRGAQDIGRRHEHSLIALRLDLETAGYSAFVLADFVHAFPTTLRRRNSTTARVAGLMCRLR